MQTKCKPIDDKPVKTEKVDWSIVPLELFRPAIEVFQDAGQKYTRCSWMYCDEDQVVRKYYAAALRHIEAYSSGEYLDTESGHPHLAHAMANLAILLWHAADFLPDEEHDEDETTHTPKVIYIAGPMRGMPRYNFGAFDAARDDLLSSGWGVISPADMDRAHGFDPDVDTPDQKFLEEAMGRDVDAIVNRADALALLPGWERSTGAQAELWLARWKHIPVFLYPGMKLLNPDE